MPGTSPGMTAEGYDLPNNDRIFRLSDSPIQGSLPLDRAGGFGGDVVDDAVDAAHLVDDAGGGAAQNLVREGEIVGGHAFGRGDGPEVAGELVGAGVAHDADRATRHQPLEGLLNSISDHSVAYYP